MAESATSVPGPSDSAQPSDSAAVLALYRPKSNSTTNLREQSLSLELLDMAGKLSSGLRTNIEVIDVNTLGSKVLPSWMVKLPMTIDRRSRKVYTDQQALNFIEGFAWDQKTVPLKTLLHKLLKHWSTDPEQEKGWAMAKEEEEKLDDFCDWDVASLQDCSDATHTAKKAKTDHADSGPSCPVALTNDGNFLERFAAMQKQMQADNDQSTPSSSTSRPPVEPPTLQQRQHMGDTHSVHSFILDRKKADTLGKLLEQRKASK